MTQPTKLQCVRLFNFMLKRANAGQRGLTRKAYALNLDFHDEEQVDDALALLVRSKHIRVDKNGLRPTITILKDNYKAAQVMQNGITLEAPLSAYEEVKSAEFNRINEKLYEQRAGTMPSPNITPGESLTDIAKARVQERTDSPARKQTAFTLSQDEYDWLLKELEETDESLSLSGLCKSLMLAEINRRRADPTPKHRISARVLRAHREDGRPLEQFITAMIETGLAAHQMNRRGI